MTKLNISPYKTNILDLIGRDDLVTSLNEKVTIDRSEYQGGNFLVYVDSILLLSDPNNFRISALIDGLVFIK